MVVPGAPKFGKSWVLNGREQMKSAPVSFDPMQTSTYPLPQPRNQGTAWRRFVEALWDLFALLAVMLAFLSVPKKCLRAAPPRPFFCYCIEARRGS